MTEDLATRCEKSQVADNALDVLIEIALFEPEEDAVSVRANAAGTKVIYTLDDGKEETVWAENWTAVVRKHDTILALKARARGKAMS